MGKAASGGKASHRGRKPAKPKHQTKAQRQRSIRELRKFFRQHPHYKDKPHKAVALSPFEVDYASEWVLGGNDEHETCLITALANSLLLVHGVRATDGEILAAGEALTMLEALAWVGANGLAGMHPRSVQMNGHASPGAVLVSGDHAVTSLRDRDETISWGGVRPLQGPLDEAWHIDWE